MKGRGRRKLREREGGGVRARGKGVAQRGREGGILRRGKADREGRTNDGRAGRS